MKQLVAIYIMLLGFSLNTIGQNLLAVENNKKFERIIYHPGEVLTFKTYDGKRWLEGQIGNVEDSTVEIIKNVVYQDGGIERTSTFRDKVPFENIRYIKYDKGNRSGWQSFSRIYSIGAMAGGVFLLAVTGINSALLDSDEGSVDGQSLLIASGISTSGLLTWLFTKRKIKFTKNWKLRAMPPFSPLQTQEAPK